jgi:hypothetical protein
MAMTGTGRTVPAGTAVTICSILSMEVLIYYEMESAQAVTSSLTKAPDVVILLSGTSTGVFGMPHAPG